MPADDALLVLDANKYLDLYRTATGKKLLAALVEQQSHIFVTQQIVDEVQRNKLELAAQFLTQQFESLKPKTYAVPDHLLGADAGSGDAIRKGMGAISDRVKALGKCIDAHGLAIMEQIFASQDEVTRALAPLFAAAVPHSPLELERVRARRERGNPPGKKGDPLGDQLTWEQILTRFQGKKRLWLISRDADYAKEFGGKWFLNLFLYTELRTLTPDAEAYVFNDVVSGIKDFAAKTGGKADKLPSEREAEQIKEEERQILPSVEAEEGRFFLNSNDMARHVARSFRGYGATRFTVFGQEEVPPGLLNPPPPIVSRPPPQPLEPDSDQG